MKNKKILTFVLAILMAFSTVMTGVGVYKNDASTVSAATAVAARTIKNPVLSASLDGGIEIYKDASYGDFVEPCDGPICLVMKVKNVSGEKRYVKFNHQNPIGDGKLTKYIADTNTFPQPNFYYLNPGQEEWFQLQVTYGSNELEDCTGALTIPVSWEVYGFEENGEQYQIANTTDNTVINVTTYSRKSMQKSKKLCTATIKGTLKDSSGNPVPNAYIRVESGYSGTMDVWTNAKGEYSVKVMPRFVAYSGKWSEYSLTAEVDGYAKRAVIVSPKEKKTMKKNIKLAKKSSKYSYKQIKKIDTKIQAYDMDNDAKGNVIATVPFHTMLPVAKTNGKRKLTVANPKTGKVYFAKDLPAETPYVDVSNDGKYIIVTSEYSGENMSNAIIYDLKGNELYRTPTQLPTLDHFTGAEAQSKSARAWCAGLSYNDKYLCYGTTEGMLYMIDWASNTILWKACLKGQIRTIDFSSDDGVVYVSDGGGDFTAFSVSNGAVLWQNFVGTWSCDTEVSKDYIAVTVKSEGNSLFVLNRQSGQLLWSYPVMYRGSGLAISPNQKYLWYGNDIGSCSSVLNSTIFNLKTGKIVSVLPHLDNQGGCLGQEAVFSSNSKEILVKNGRGFGIYKVKTGEELYAKTVLKKGVGDSLTFSLYTDGKFKNVVAGFNDKKGFRFWGQLYFFQRQ